MTKQNKKPILSSKTLKAQLLSVIAMLVVASVALSSATYAWFVNNSTVTINTMQFQATTAQALQVAVRYKNAASGAIETTAEEKNTIYKNIISNSDITAAIVAGGTGGAGWTQMFSAISATTPTIENFLLSPASTVDTEDFFWANGIMNGNLLGEFEKIDNATAETVDINSADYKYVQVGEGYVKSIPLSFLSSVDMKVYFGNNEGKSIISPVIAGDTATAEEQAECDDIKKAIRIAIVPEDTNDETTIFQFSEDHLVGAAYNTDYNSIPAAVTVNEAEGKYNAIDGVNVSKKITAVGEQTAIISANIGKYIATVADSGTSVTAPANPAHLFELEEGVAENVTIYIWLEGTDMDCVSVLSHYKFAIDLQFAGIQITA